MKRLNAYLVIAILISIGLLVFAGCASKEEEPSGWTTLFEDNFNRANTTGRNLGTNYEIYGFDPDEMYILNNEVYSSYATQGSGGVIAIYNGTVNYENKLRISVKFKVVVVDGWPDEYAGIVINMNKDTWESYFLEVMYTFPDGHYLYLGEFDGSDVVNEGIGTISSFSSNTWYILEIESDGEKITGKLKDETGASVLATVTLTDSPRSYTTGSVAFYNYVVDGGTPQPDYPVYFDDFKIEEYR